MKRACFDLDWRFQLGGEDGTAGREFDDGNWRTLDLPHDWSIELERSPDAPGGDQGGFFQDGVGWYRKHFRAPPEWRGRRIMVEFEGVYRDCQVWLNGHYLGAHPYGYTSFLLDLTGDVEDEADNVLAVRVDNSTHRHSRWYSGSGIYRHVWIIAAAPVHIAHWGVSVTTPRVTDEHAEVAVSTSIENHGNPVHAEIRWQIFAADGAQVAATAVEIAVDKEATATGMLTVAAPQRWDVDTPYLYRMHTEVVVDDQIRDADSVRFGIRSFSFDPDNGFVLNGRSLPLRGGCVHHDCGPLGAASIDRAEERKVEILKANGFNAVRCAHNPPAPAFLDACDRLGMLVIDEAFDVWRARKLPYDYHRHFDDWWQRDLDSMLYRDRNHPSIVLWSIGNELSERGEPEGADIAGMLAGHVRRVEPTRPVTAAICVLWGPGEWRQTDGLFACLDVCGYNYQRSVYEADHQRFPARVIVATESFPPEAWDYWQAVKTLPYVAGDFVWTALDYLGEVGIGHTFRDGEKARFCREWPWHQANCGDIDLCGGKRPQSRYRDIVWERGQALFVAVHPPAEEQEKIKVSQWGWYDVQDSWTWDVSAGYELRVDVYAACASVELRLNGRAVGQQVLTPADKHIATFAVPYQPGTLTAVGCDNDGNTVAKIDLTTAGQPRALRLSADRNPIRADRNDLVYIDVDVVDAQNRRVPTAMHEIFFSLQGNGRIAAVANADARNCESYRGNRHRAFRGRCLVVVQPTGEPGRLTLRAQADHLEPTALEVRLS